MIDVPGGTFTQRDTLGNKFSHTLSNFKIGKYEVSYELWYKVLKWSEEHGYHIKNKGMEGSETGGGDDPDNYLNLGKEPTESGKYQPATVMCWRDAVVWCNAYSELCGYSPVYKYQGKALKDSRNGNNASFNNAVMDTKANGYRLPTEGEWQYAASYKDGTNFTPFNHASGSSKPWGEDGIYDSSALNDFAWWRENSDDKTHEVGGKTPNALEIHDMSGNVWEMCWDRYDSYPSNPQTDYLGPNNAASLEHMRHGGACVGLSIYPQCLQVGFRSPIEITLKDIDMGFRVARTVSSES